MCVPPNRKFLLTKPMHMAAEDSEVCQLHSISEDSVSSGICNQKDFPLLSSTF